MGIKLRTVTCLGLGFPLSLWLPFDIPEVVTDEKQGQAELITHLELRLCLKGTTRDSQHLLTLLKRVECWCEICRHSHCPALNVCLPSHPAINCPRNNKDQASNPPVWAKS